MIMYSGTGNAQLVRLHTNYTKSNGWQAKNHRKIEIAAYYKAQARGFKPGKELNDWLEAEAEIAQTFVPPHEFFV